MSGTELSLSKQPDLVTISSAAVMETKIRLSLLLLEISVRESSRLEKLIAARDFAESKIFDESSLRAYSISDLKEIYPVLTNSIADAKNSVQNTVSTFSPEDLSVQIDLLKGMMRMDASSISSEDLRDRADAEDIARQLLAEVVRGGS